MDAQVRSRLRNRSRWMRTMKNRRLPGQGALRSLDGTDWRGQAVKVLRNFVRDDQAQDMVEYTLLLAFVALAAGAAWVGIAPATSKIVSLRDADLSMAASVAH